MAKCMYCNVELPENSVVDVCRSCGYQVWGEKMFSAIIENMENAKETGDLFQGSVTIQKNQPKITPQNEFNFNSNIEILD